MKNRLNGIVIGAALLSSLEAEPNGGELVELWEKSEPAVRTRGLGADRGSGYQAQPLVLTTVVSDTVAATIRNIVGKEDEAVATRSTLSRGTGPGRLQLNLRKDNPSASPRVEVTIDVKKEVAFRFEFKNDSTAFANEAQERSKLNSLEVAMTNPAMADKVFIVAGHASAPGAEDHNHTLSERRAQAVRDRLIELGVRPEQLLPLGFGETRLEDAADTEEAHAKNRRVTVVPIERKVRS